MNCRHCKGKGEGKDPAFQRIGLQLTGGPS
jgi:hypothetical protein